MLREQTAGEQSCPQAEGTGTMSPPGQAIMQQEKAGCCGQEKKGILGKSIILAKAPRYEKAEFICVAMSSTG